jgi:hypothetical protein
VKLNNLILGVILFFVAHFLTFYQLNGQFFSKWFQKNEWIVIASGSILSIFYVLGTKYTVMGTDGLLWPARFIGFGIGMLLYAFLVSYHFDEGISIKTLISLLLCILLISIQLFWK